jgi:hypothetical protein
MDGLEIILITTGLLAIVFFRVQAWKRSRDGTKSEAKHTANREHSTGKQSVGGVHEFGGQFLIVLIIFILVGNFLFAAASALFAMAYSWKEMTLFSIPCAAAAAVAGVVAFRFIKARFILKCGAIGAGALGLAFFDTPARPLVAPLFIGAVCMLPSLIIVEGVRRRDKQRVLGARGSGLVDKHAPKELE